MIHSKLNQIHAIYIDLIFIKIQYIITFVAA